MCQVISSIGPRSPGFSVPELAITLCIVAILTSLAAPGVGAMWLDSQRATAVNSFVHSVFLARSTAMQQGEEVSICRSSDGQTCSNRTADWQVGWIVFVNNDRDHPPVRDGNEALLAVFAARDAGTITSNRVSYSFRPHINGVVNGTVVFCDRRGPSQARAVIINYLGRPRVAGRDSDNRPLRCPSG